MSQRESKLIKAYQHVVTRAARSIANTFSLHHHLDDLVAYGNKGLLLGLRNFDPTRGAKLHTYLRLRVHGAILDGLRKLLGPRGVRNQHCVPAYVAQGTRCSAGVPGSLEEDEDSGEHHGHPPSAHAPLPHDPQWHASRRFASPSDHIEEKITRQRLDYFVSELPLLEQHIVNATRMGLTIAQMAASLDCTNGWVCRIRQRAYQNLKIRILESGDLF